MRCNDFVADNGKALGMPTRKTDYKFKQAYTQISSTIIKRKDLHYQPYNINTILQLEGLKIIFFYFFENKLKFKKRKFFFSFVLLL